MRYRQRTYEHSTASGRLARRKSSRRFPPFFMNNSEYRSLLNCNIMKQKHEFKSIVAETLLIPLYMRAKESRRVNPILNDKAAERLADSLEYDYSQFDGAKLSEVGCVVRGWYFDRLVFRPCRKTVYRYASPSGSRKCRVRIGYPFPAHRQPQSCFL